MGDLRNALFDTLQRLQDPEEGETMDVEKAKAISGLAKEINNSFKHEITATKMLIDAGQLDGPKPGQLGINSPKTDDDVTQ